MALYWKSIAEPSLTLAATRFCKKEVRPSIYRSGCIQFASATLMCYSAAWLSFTGQKPDDPSKSCQAKSCYRRHKPLNALKPHSIPKAHRISAKIRAIAGTTSAAPRKSLFVYDLDLLTDYLSRKAVDRHVHSIVLLAFDVEHGYPRARVPCIISGF